MQVKAESNIALMLFRLRFSAAAIRRSKGFYLEPFTTEDPLF